MKKLSIFFIVAILGLISCDPLDVEPLDKIPAEDAIKDEKGLKAAISGVYDILQSDGIAMDGFVFAELTADNLIHIGTKKEYRQFSENSIVTENAYVEGMWNSCYDGINRVNNILNEIDAVTGVDDSQLEFYKGECYFLRAFLYHTLVKYYGGVPIRKEPTVGISDEELSIPRASVADVYSLIIDDLTTAETKMAGSGKGNSVSANEGAVKALLARVYLYNEQWGNAVTKAQEVIDMGYQLVDSTSYASLYDEQATNSEIIFQIDFANDDDVNAIADYFMPDARFEVAAWRTTAREQSIADEFEEGDYRKEATVGVTPFQGVDEFYCKKYDDIVGESDNVIVLRLAEMYLIKAEALNEQSYEADGDAFVALNTIRERAGLTELTSAEVATQDDFRLAVEKERRLELAFEGHRMIDLRRTGRAADVLPDIGTFVSANQMLLPIPQSEVDLNTAITANNPGY